MACMLHEESSHRGITLDKTLVHVAPTGNTWPSDS